MKRPNLAWRNHCIFSSCDLGAGRGLAPGCARAVPAESKARQIFNDKLWEIPRFMVHFLVILYSLTKWCEIQVRELDSTERRYERKAKSGDSGEKRREVRALLGWTGREACPTGRGRLRRGWRRGLRLRLGGRCRWGRWEEAGG